MSENDLLLSITHGTRKNPGLCKVYGLRFYHPYSSLKSSSGFPDLVIAGRSVLYRELKSQKGRLSPAQVAWLADLDRAGCDVGVWRPASVRSRPVRRRVPRKTASTA